MQLIRTRQMHVCIKCQCLGKRYGTKYKPLALAPLKRILIFRLLCIFLLYFLLNTSFINNLKNLTKITATDGVIKTILNNTDHLGLYIIHNNYEQRRGKCVPISIENQQPYNLKYCLNPPIIGFIIIEHRPWCLNEYPAIGDQSLTGILKQLS